MQLTRTHPPAFWTVPCAGSQQEVVAGVREALLALREVLQEGARRLLTDLGGVAAQRWALESWRDVFFNLVQAQVESTLLSLSRRFAAQAGVALPGGAPAAPAAAGPPPPALLLVLSHACTFMERQVAGEAAAQLEELASGGRQTLLQRGAGGGGSPELQRGLAEAAGALLDGYAAARGGAAAADVQRAVDAVSWDAHPQPTGPSAACGVILDALSVIDIELAAAAAAAGAADAEAPAGPHHSRHRTGSSSLDSSYAQPPDAAAPPRADVAAAASHRALRAHASALRRHALGRAGFQQVQLDCHYLRPQVQRAVAGAGGGPAALQALDEVLVAAAERCREGAVMLEPSVLDRLIAGAARA
jgi:hypothetical protein